MSEDQDEEWEDCYSCGADNAVPFDPGGGDVKCSKCGAEFTWDWIELGGDDAVYGLRLRDGYV